MSSPKKEVLTLEQTIGISSKVASIGIAIGQTFAKCHLFSDNIHHQRLFILWLLPACSLVMKMMMVTMTEMRNLMMTMMMSVIMAVKKVLKMMTLILIRRETAVLKTSLKTGAERAKEACTPR